MKKIMIVAAVVCAAAFAQAASINWGSAVADPSDSTGNTPATAGWNAYLLYSATDLSSIATKLDGLGVGAMADNGAKVVGVHTITAGEVDPAFSFQDEYIAADVNGFYQMLVVDEANNKFGAVDKTFAVTGITDLNSPGEVYYNMDFGEGFDKFAGETGWSGTVAIPEPTSGMLLLLGIAGLALKRKRA